MKNKLVVLIGLILLLLVNISFSQQFNLEWEIDKKLRYLGDIDGDGNGEFYAGLSGIDTTWFYDANTHDIKWTIAGKGRWLFKYLWQEMGSGNPYSLFPIIDFNGDSVKEMWFCLRDDNGNCYKLMLVDITNNTNIFELEDSQANYEIRALADVDNDNALELVITDKKQDRSYVYSTAIATTSVKQNILERPSMYKLRQNYPNPFNPNTKIEYEIQMDGFATLKIYNALGQLVKTLVNEQKQAGSYSVIWDGKNDNGQIASSGVYFYTLKIGENTLISKRMLLLK